MPAELVVYANMRRKPQNLTHSIPSSRAGDRGGGGGGVGRGTSRPSAISNNRRPRDHRHLMAMVVSTLPLALLLLLVQTTGKSWPEAGTVRGEGQWHAQQKNFTCIQLINWTLIVRPVPADNFHGFKQSGRMKVEIKPRSCVDICIVFSIDAKLTGFVLIGSCPIGWEGIWKSNALLCNKNPLHLADIWIEWIFLLFSHLCIIQANLSHLFWVHLISNKHMFSPRVLLKRAFSYYKRTAFSTREHNFNF